jgi:hypothetical protein
VASIDRPYVFNSSYTYQLGKFSRGDALVRGVVGGWTISGISTWQAGGSLLAELGNSVPNFGLTESYTNIPAGISSANGGSVSTGIGTATYYGTDAPLAIRPALTCNPNHGLAKYQRLNVACFAAPPIGQQGGQAYPYMSMGSYFDNDIALYKAFPVTEKQSVQFRVSVFDWLNHPLPEFSSANQVTLKYLVDYNSKAVTLNTASGGTVPNFGFMDTKTANPYERIVELNVKYVF